MFVYKSRVIFVGEENIGGSVGQIDIYFPSNGAFITLRTPTRLFRVSSYVAGSKAYIFSHTFQPRLVVLDLLTNTITKELTLPMLGITSTARSSTHAFILHSSFTESILFTLKFGQDNPVRLSGDPSQIAGQIVAMFLDNRNRIFFIGRNQIIPMRLPQLTTDTRYPSVPMEIEGTIQVGSDIYLFGPNQLTVISTLRPEVTQYQMSVQPFQGVSAVEWNGRIYFTAQSSAASVLTVNTNALFKTYSDMQVSYYTHMAINGFYFAIRTNPNRLPLQYIKLTTGQMLTYTFERLDTLSNVVPVAVDDTRLVIFSASTIDMFDTVTETWSTEVLDTRRSISNQASSTSLKDLAVFLSGRYCYIFNTTSRESVALLLEGVASTVIAVGDSLAFLVENNYHLYNVYSKQWISNITRPVQSRIGETIGVHKGLLFDAGGIVINGNHLDDVIVLNSTDGLIRHLHLSAPRSYVEFLGVGDYVIFAGGLIDGRSLTSSAIDILNIVTFQWRTLFLHRTPLGRVAMTPWKNSVFFTLPGAIELLDLTTMTLQQTFIQFSSPEDAPRGLGGGSFGSKVVLFGTSETALTATFYETTTRTATSATIDVIDRRRLQKVMMVTKNFLIFVTNGYPRVLQFAAIENDLHDTELFYNETTTFDAAARGVDLKSQWYHNTVPLLDETQTALTVNNVTQSSEGIYSIRVVDQCNQVMIRQANLTVHGPPVIIDELTESIIMCHEEATISTNAHGVQVTYNWTIGSRIQTANNSTITVTGDAFECNTSHQLCVSVINPSGSTSQCTTVRIVDHDSVFSGPRPVSSLPLLIRETDVDLEVTLLDDECESHEWVVNGVKTGIRGERSSVMTVHLDQDTISQSFSVIAWCGNSQLAAREFKFTNVSSLNVIWLVLVVVVCFLVVVGALLTAYLVRRRAIASHKAEVELESLLNQAKAETLNRDGVPILKSTTWEWTPNEQFTFKPINKMSFALDSTALTSLNKHEPVKVGVWNQNIISFSSLGGGSSSKTKVKRTNVLKERLIGGTHIDIYAPRSPKYEIKIEPSSFDIDDPDTPIHVTVSSMMSITAKCKVGLIVVCEQEQVYSIVEFKLTSAMSTWIDLEEIEMTGDYLGGGGFGSVTRGVYRGQDVAVKKLLSQYLTPEMHVEFEREIMLMKDLHHPNIVQFVGASNIKDSLAIVIEYAPLGSLASVIEKHSLTLNMKMTMLLESAKALQFLHANGIIHRDIKPQNILVFSLEPKSSVHIKLTDFGTARLISEEAMTVTKNIGTTCFMAPESLGKNPRIEKSADVYSFALLMWSVLFEQTPFSEFKWDSDLEAHVKQGHRLPFPSDHNIDGALTSLISECWEHEPNKRPSMATVVQRLTVLSSTLK